MRTFARHLSKRLHRWVVYPVILALRGEANMYSALRELESLQWAPHQSLAARQAGRLADILDFAARTVPWHRERWGGDVAITPENAMSVLKTVPRLSKEELQEAGDSLLSEERPRRVSSKTTGGSTGRPVTVWKDSRSIARERAASWLGYGWFGIRIGDRGARFWGSPQEVSRRRMRFAAADLAMNRIRFSAFAFEEENLETYWKRCLRWRPDYFYGYVSMLTEFARHLEEAGRDGRRLDLKAVVTTSEALTRPQRELLEEVFGAPVQNEYGCGEVGAVAYECPEGGLHVMADNVLVELLDEEGDPVPEGEPGDVVITDLRNRAMPLIRYDVGDRAAWDGSCSCGRAFPTLGRIQGRAYDFVRDREGRRYHGEFFMYLFEDLRDRGGDIGQFRVTQTSATDLVIEIDASRELSADQEDFVRNRIRRQMTGIEPNLEYVDRIERMDSGKIRVIRNQWLGGNGNS